MINSKKKGSRGELELAHYLVDHGFDARRGQQFKGTSDSPDVVSDLIAEAGFQIECKRVEAGNLYNWLDQATKDAGVTKYPVVMHRRNDKPWVAILHLDNFLELLHTVLQTKGKENGCSQNSE